MDNYWNPNSYLMITQITRSLQLATSAQPRYKIKSETQKNEIKEFI